MATNRGPYVSITIRKGRMTTRANVAGQMSSAWLDFAARGGW
jgi:hypothetical protein